MTATCSEEFFRQWNEIGQLWHLRVRHWRQKQPHSKAESVVEEVNKIQSDELILI